MSMSFSSTLNAVTISSTQQPQPIPQPLPRVHVLGSNEATQQKIAMASLPTTRSPSSPINQVGHSLQSIQPSGGCYAAFTYPNVPKDEIESKPWKYEGYRGLCQYMASSSDALVLRRFDTINTRVILSMQDEIVQLETELEALDQKCMQGEDAMGRSNSLRYDPQPRRKEIIKVLRILLKDYNEYILAYSELRARSSAEKFQVRNVKRWFARHKTAIHCDEQEFIKEEEDLIPIIPETKSWLRLGIEKINPIALQWLFPESPRASHAKNKDTICINPKAIDATMTFVIVTIGLAILLGPLWALNRVTTEADGSGTIRLSIITGCIALFTLILASASVARPFEVLVGIAGYAAVLMVFMQVQNSSSSSSTSDTL